MNPPDSERVIRRWLEQEGHKAEEIEKILARLRQYDQTVVRSAIFDSIQTGGFNLDAVIDEALRGSK